jgi:putative FmdB family regulatory protein
LSVPIYEYECPQCETVSDIRHGFKESAGPCAECGGQLKRIFRPAGIVFKGAGFYVTDSRKPSVDGGSSKPSKPSDPAAPKPGDAAKSDSGKSDAARSDSKSSKGSEAAA